MFYESLRDYIYDKILGSATLGEGSTTSLYRKALESIPPNSRVLDVGIGNGTCAVENMGIIRKKNIRITGIDIDTGYIQAAKQKIMVANAGSHITANVVDLMSIEDQKWDFILFSESYPVIDSELMSSLWKASLKLLEPGGKILMIHNLCDHPAPLFKLFKTNAKYFTLVDFGKTTSMDEFVSHLRENNLRIKGKRVLFPMLMTSYPKHIRTSFLANILAFITGTTSNSGWRKNNQWLFEIEEIL